MPWWGWVLVAAGVVAVANLAVLTVGVLHARRSGRVGPAAVPLRWSAAARRERRRTRA